MVIKASPLATLADPGLLQTDALINGEWVAGTSRFDTPTRTSRTSTIGMRTDVLAGTCSACDHRRPCRKSMYERGLLP